MLIDDADDQPPILEAFRTMGLYVLAWVALAAALLGAMWILAVVLTGEPPGVCGGPTGLFGLSVSVNAALGVGLSGATAVVGGHWALRKRRRPVVFLRIGAVVVAAFFFGTLSGIVIAMCPAMH